MLIGGVVDHQFGNHPDAALVGFGDESLEIFHRAVGGVDRLVISDVIAVIAQRRGVEWQQPDGGDAQLLHIIQPLHQARKIADAIAVRIHERLDVQLVDDGILVPVRLITVYAAAHGEAGVIIFCIGNVHERGTPGARICQMA